MPLPTEIDQYPSARLLLRRQIGRQKPKFWRLNPSRVVDEWQWVWKTRPHLVMPFWEMETTRWKDISYNARIGTAAAGQIPVWGTSQVGFNYLWDEVDDRIEIPNFAYEADQATVTPQLTFAIVFRVAENSGTSFQYFFCHGGAINAANFLAVYFGEQSSGGGIAGTITINRWLVGDTQARFIRIPAGGWDNGQWHYLVFTLEPPNTVRGYVDGIQRISQVIATGSGFNPSLPFRIGCDGVATPTSTRFFGSHMAFLGVFRGVWTASQVAAWTADPWGLLTPKRGPIIGFRPADTIPDPPGTGQPMVARRRYRAHVGPRLGGVN